MDYKKARIASLTAFLLQVAVTHAHASACVGAEGEQAAASYQRGLEKYRAGRLDNAYEDLKAAYSSCPASERYRNDYLLSAVGTGHAPDALAIADHLNMGTLPPFVLEALGRGARDLHRPELAVRYYDLILSAGENVGVRVGRDLAIIDQGRIAQAQADLLELNVRYPNRADVLEALGLADEARGDWIPALAAAEALLRLDPQHAGALALRFRVLMALGAPQLAESLTPRSSMTPQLRTAALQAELAFEIRWARNEPRADKVRAAKLDGVIAQLREALSTTSLDAVARQAMRADLIEALHDRGRCRDAVYEFESMRKDGATVPPHAIGAALDSYLTLRQPERAVELYRTLPLDSHPSFVVRTSNFYALLESGHYREAIVFADALAASEPQYLDADSPGLRSENPDYVTALVLAGLARAYTEQLADAGVRIRGLVNRAPGNQDANIALAETYALRGWPRASLATASGVLQIDSDLDEATVRVFDAQLQMADWSAAHATLGQMSGNRAADDAALARAAREWQVHDSAEISVDAQIGKSYGARTGLVDSTVEEYAYTAPFAWNYRAYVHLDQAEGNPIQGNTYRHAVGAGLEFHTQDLLATVELLEIDRAAPAPQVSVEFTPNDYWQFGGSYSLRTLDIPIAAVVVGVHADRAAVNLDYRVSELRDFGVVLKHEEFSDSNSRYEGDVYWHERWISGPVYKFDTRFDLELSHNTLAATNYFNPLSDTASTVTLRNQWVQFRRYDRELTHELDIVLGDYAQQGYSSGLIASIRYSLNYQINDRVVVKAGLGRGVRPYDGSRERLDVITLNLVGRF